jgi:peptide/nickel transport system permease protein
MIADGREYLQSAWWIATMPGVALGLTVIGINYFGDGLRELMDPRPRTAS